MQRTSRPGVLQYSKHALKPLALSRMDQGSERKTLPLHGASKESEEQSVCGTHRSSGTWWNREKAQFRVPVTPGPVSRLPPNTEGALDRSGGCVVAKSSSLPDQKINCCPDVPTDTGAVFPHRHAWAAEAAPGMVREVPAAVPAAWTGLAPAQCDSHDGDSPLSAVEDRGRMG